MAGLGLSDAIDAYIQTKKMVADNAYVQSQRDRQAKMNARDDASMAEEDAAQQAGRDVMAAKAAKWQESQGLSASPQSVLTPDGTPTLPAAGDTPAAVGLSSASQLSGPMAGGGKPTQAYTPTEEDYHDAMAAHTAALTPLSPAWQKSWGAQAALRDKLRNKYLDELDGAVRGGGDVAGAMTKAYRYIGDGHEIKGVDVQQDDNGNPIYQVTRTMSDGTEKVDALRPDQLDAQVAWARDPQSVRQHEVQIAIEQAKAKAKTQQAIDEEAGKQPFALARIKAQGENLSGVATIKANASAENAQTRANATLGAAGLRRGSGGSGASSPDKLDLGAAQQQSIALGREGQQLNSWYALQMKNAPSEFSDEGKTFREMVQQRYNASVADMDKRRALLNDRLSKLGAKPAAPASPGLGLSSATKPPAPKPAPASNDFSSLWK